MSEGPVITIQFNDNINLYDARQARITGAAVELPRTWLEQQPPRLDARHDVCRVKRQHLVRRELLRANNGVTVDATGWHVSGLASGLRVG